jgi:hypothetical protein
VSRHIIAKENQIGTGTVSRIIRGFKEDGFDLDLLREVGLLLKREGLDANLLSYSVRLRKRLEERGLDEMKIDSLIDTIDVHCFRRSITVEEFVDRIQNISSLSEDLGIPLDQLPQHIARQKEEFENQIREVEDIKIKRKKLLQAVGVTLDKLRDYDKNKHKLQNYEAMEKRVNDLQQQLNYYRGPGKIFLDISKEQIKNMNTFLVNPIDIDDLAKMLHYLCHNPIQNMGIILNLQKQALGISNNHIFGDEPSETTEN